MAFLQREDELCPITCPKMPLAAYYCILITILSFFTSLIFATKDSREKNFFEEIEDEFENNFGEQRIVFIHSRVREKRSLDHSSVENPGEIDLIIEEKEKGVHFHLLPNNDLLSPGYKVIVRGTNGTIEEELTGPKNGHCLFVGFQKGKLEYSAAFSNCAGDGFTGVFVDESGTHIVRPLNNSSGTRKKRSYSNLTSEGLHVINTKQKDSKCALRDMRAMTAPTMARALTPEELTTGDIGKRGRIMSHNSDAEFIPEFADERPKTPEMPEDVESIEVGSEYHRWKREALNRYKIETAVFVDDEMYSSFKKKWGIKGRFASFIEDYVLTIMNAVYLLYKAPSLKTDISISVSRLEILKEPLSKLGKANGKIMSYLSNFCGWQARLKKSILQKDAFADTWDHGLLLTGLDLWDLDPDDKDVIGLAWVAGMCRPYFSCTINEGKTFEAVYVITHEVGHNLNMSHDGSERFNNFCDKDRHIMSRSTGAGKVTWSGCSNKELERFLEFERDSLTCLVQEKIKSRTLDKPQDKLPGEAYDAEQQCVFAMNSEKAKPYITSSDPYNNICDMLWCQLGNIASQSHPALEGTPCNRGKGRCSSGECIHDIQTGFYPSKDDDNEIPDKRGSPRSRDRNSFKNLFVNIKDFFKRYLFLRKGQRSESLTTIATTEWTLFNLTECSAQCGGGWQEGEVVCVDKKSQESVDELHCNANMKPPSKTSCNTLPCRL